MFYNKFPAAWFHSRIIVGPGSFLTNEFAVKNRITHVINCAFEHDSPKWFRERFPERYACMNAYDNNQVNILYWYPKFESAMKKFLRDENAENIYVHCQAGMNRSGFLALAYVCAHFNLPLETVVASTKLQRPILFQNVVFMNQVKNFINGHLQSSKNTRHLILNVDNGHIGFSTSRDSPQSQRIENITGNDTRRSETITATN